MKREVFQQSSSFPVLNKCQDCQDLCFHSFQMINRNFNQKIINTVDSKFISEVQILNPISLNPTQLLVPDWLFVTNLFFFLCVRLDARAVNCFKLRLSNF